MLFGIREAKRFIQADDEDGAMRQPLSQLSFVHASIVTQNDVDQVNAAADISKNSLLGEDNPTAWVSTVTEVAAILAKTPGKTLAEMMPPLEEMSNHLYPTEEEDRRKIELEIAQNSKGNLPARFAADDKNPEDKVDRDEMWKKERVRYLVFKTCENKPKMLQQGTAPEDCTSYTVLPMPRATDRQMPLEEVRLPKWRADQLNNPLDPKRELPQNKGLLPWDKYGPRQGDLLTKQMLVVFLESSKVPHFVDSVGDLTDPQVTDGTRGPSGSQIKPDGNNWAFLGTKFHWQMELLQEEMRKLPKYAGGTGETPPTYENCLAQDFSKCAEDLNELGKSLLGRWIYCMVT